jgi:hypothetical protein
LRYIVFVSPKIPGLEFMETVSGNIMRPKFSDFNIAHNQNDLDIEVRLYTKAGDQDFIDDNNNPRLNEENDRVYAKAVKDKPSKDITNKSPKGFTYYIKADPNKNLYNPTELYSVQSKTPKSFLNKVCKSELRFLEVSESIFNKYINFLKTENTQWLTNAQREVK